MIFGTTIFTIACLVTVVVVIYFSIVRNRSPFTDTTPIGWWIIGLGISQLFLLAPFAAWYQGWWSNHQNILNGSAITATTCAIIWILVWIAQRR